MNPKLLFCFTLAFSACLHKAQAQPSSPSIQAYENRRVRSLEIQVENLPPGSSFDRQTILSKMRTQEGDPFSQYIFDQDLKQLAQNYDRVEPNIEIQDGKVDIVIRVFLRPVISQIEWEGNSYIKTRTLRKELDIKPGTIFNRNDFNNAFNKVKEYYVKKGYFESELSYHLIPELNSREVKILITIREGRSGKVQDIVFHGFTKEEESHILQKFYTKKYSTLTSWFTGQGRFIEEALEQDRLTIFDYLQNKGYADARVSIQVVESPEKGKIILDISADKGYLYRFGYVSFDGNILFTNEEIEKLFLAHPDGVYSPDRLRKTSEAIKDLYGRKGFIDTSVSYETQLDRAEPIYNVHFQIDEGRKYRIGMIRIIGNLQTESRVILRESLLVPGETFDSLKLKVTQARLENIGYFKSVNVYTVRTQDDLSLGDNYRDIYIEVEETQTGNVSLFSGFSSANSIFGGLDLTERNFNHKGLGRLFSDGPGSLRGGGEFLHMRASIGPKEQSYLISWLTPYFLDTLYRFGFEFVATTNSEMISKDFDITTYNFGLFLSYPLSPYLSYGFKYRVKNYDVEVEKKIINEVQNQNKIADSNEKGILSGLGASLNWDSTDSALKPHRGLRSSLEGEVVGLGGDLNFFRTAFINAYYTPLWRRGYMRYRADFRFLYPFGKSDAFKNIPISERFYLGGIGSVRGYKDFAIGQQFDVKNSNGQISKSPTGGLSASLLSIEYIQEILPFIDSFVFIDAGYVSQKTFDLETYRMSYGIGFNIDVLGRIPVTIGWGFPINAQERAEKPSNHFFFSMGGQF